MDFAPHSSVFCLANNERGVNVPSSLLIIHHDIRNRSDFVQVIDLVLVVCRRREVVRRLDVQEGIVHFI